MLPTPVTSRGEKGEQEMNLSYNETKMILEMVWLGIENGNRAEGKPFIPTPEQYKMLCAIANCGEDYVAKMQKDYGLE